MDFTILWYLIAACLTAGIIFLIVGFSTFGEPSKSKNWFFAGALSFLVPLVLALIILTIDQLSLPKEYPSNVPYGFIFFGIIVIVALLIARFGSSGDHGARNSTLGCSVFLLIILIVFMFFLTMMMTFMQPPIPGEKYNNFRYVEESGQITITHHWGEDKNVKIPSVIKGKSVTRIGYEAFANNVMTGVVIPDSITKIDTSAFAWCSSLTNVTIPDSVTEIGKGAFQNCEKVVIYCKEDSYAHKYAVDNKIEYVLVE